MGLGMSWRPAFFIDLGNLLLGRFGVFAPLEGETSPSESAGCKKCNTNKT
jgi:hypothetical protein